MADSTHVERLRLGRGAIAAWRREFPDKIPDVSGADLAGLDLSFAELQGADLRGANLEGANLTAAEVSGANLQRTNLSQANLTWVHARETKFHWANLRGADLFGIDADGADLSGADLTDAHLISAGLRNARLIGTKIVHCDLTWSDFRSSKFVYGKISRSTVRGTDFRGCDFRESGMHIVYGAFLQPAIFDRTTLWPEGFVPGDFFQNADEKPLDERILAVSIDPGNAEREVVVELFLALESLHRTHGGVGLKLVRAEIPAPAFGIEQATLTAKGPDGAEGASSAFFTEARRLNRSWKIPWGPSSWRQSSASSEFRSMVERRRILIAALHEFERLVRRVEKVVFSLSLKKKQIPLSPEEAQQYAEAWEMLHCHKADEASARVAEAVHRIQGEGGRVDVAARRSSGVSQLESESGD